ncbi:MAG: integral rane protein-like protein [Cyanobacteria bacterium RYN_339]|nr:integral rane protein-like protein [Cyanobacteria bacterium RYN_339]
MRVLLAVAVLLGLVVAACTYQGFDFVACWIPWSEATRGTSPWLAYSVPGCNYPALALYALTCSELARQALHVPSHGLGQVLLIKLPFTLPYLAGAIAVARQGTAWGRWALPLAPPLLINAVVWGQTDAALAIALAAAVSACARERPYQGAALFGLALSLKLQAIIAIPAALVFGLRRFGPGRTLAACALALGLMALVALPFFVQGYAGYVLSPYFLVVDAYPAIEKNAFNGWFLVDLPFRWSGRGLADAIALAGPLTPKWLGLAGLAGYAAVVLARLWRQPTPTQLKLAAALLAFAFFMLPTQIHERYLVPAVGLWALAADELPPARPIFWGLCITASLNQLLVLGFDPGGLYPSLPRHLILACGAVLALANLALFALATRLAFATPSEAPAA